ncbi:lytic transglycosylase [Gilvimarinus xylanilyticus]|uniref:LysM peptidoglycan-binding domain-containing protein n=1 Tax=Gilvimarinus xylanilyticus TaxID=2944139 RepID=A0A9X2KSV5_9GAMM|nr:LysM peptidoglycan-binding domain-containing protein [Gilvimarinus xylanilyticus]MCP8898527.1 LysM peptidoglycan-binding domain-containing protein [Gilvimarinus xylanilyticus]
MSVNRLFFLAASCIVTSCGLISEKPEPAPSASETAAVSAPQATLPPPTIRKLDAEKPEEDLWQRLRQGFELGPYEQAQLDSYVQWYIDHPDYIERVFNRGQRYLYHITERLEEENLPLEIALLPVVESAFDPYAYSYATASGMWQFMSGTGSDYGLKQNWWYDGRRDIIDSTDAALAYLEQLQEMFDGDWLHALAAYNTGQGRLQRSINRNRNAGKSTDFWSLKLPRETRNYVPRLLALSKVVANPEKYNISLPPIANAPYFVAVDIQSQLDLTRASELAGISMDELYALNPGFNRWATDPEGPHRLLMPLDAQATFTEALAKLPDNERISWQRYAIRRGDSLSTIARQFDTSVDVLRTANKLSSSRIRAGDTLLIPSASVGSESYALEPQGGNAKRSYIVKKGDSFWQIANRHKISVDSLVKWNGMSSRDTLQPGQKLVIWEKSQAPGNAQGITRKLTYKVRRGDSLNSIASKFNVSIHEITRWNNVSTANYIHPGQQLTLFVGVTKAR